MKHEDFQALFGRLLVDPVNEDVRTLEKEYDRLRSKVEELEDAKVQGWIQGHEDSDADVYAEEVQSLRKQVELLTERLGLETGEENQRSRLILANEALRSEVRQLRQDLLATREEVSP